MSSGAYIDQRDSDVGYSFVKFPTVPKKRLKNGVVATQPKAVNLPNSREGGEAMSASL